MEATITPQHVSETSANGTNSSCMLSLDTKQLDGHHAKEIKIAGNLDLLCHEHKDSREVESNKHEAMVPAIETSSTFNISCLSESKSDTFDVLTEQLNNGHEHIPHQTEKIPNGLGLPTLDGNVLVGIEEENLKLKNPKRARDYG